jgi:hypothetical protein
LTSWWPRHPTRGSLLVLALAGVFMTLFDLALVPLVAFGALLHT